MNTTVKRYLPVAVFIVMIALGFILYGGHSQNVAKNVQPTSQSPDSMQVPTSIDYVWMILKMLLILGGVCGLAWLSLKWILPRMYGPTSKFGKSNRIELIESYRLDPRRSLFLVRVDGHLFFLAGSEKGINLLADLGSEPDEKSFQDISQKTSEKEVSHFEKLLRGKK